MRKRKAQAIPAPVEATTFWLELDEQDVRTLNTGSVPPGVIAATYSFLEWLRSPAAGIAHDRAVRFSQAIEEPDPVPAVSRNAE